MPIVIHLRTEIESCLYRDAIIGSLTSGLGDAAILCSGFFQENYKSSSYQATAEPGLIAGLTKYKIRLETFGVHNRHWLPSYKKFYANLKAGGVSIKAWVQKGFQWHAKVFILKHGDIPLFGIIGSSNITANAFGVKNSPIKSYNSPNPPRQFNYESDVFIWEGTNRKLDTAVSAILFPKEPQHQTSRSIRARYFTDDNGGMTITQRLIELEDQVRNAGTNEELVL